MAASVSGAVLNIALNYLFLSPRWFDFGYVAAGYTTLICYILYAAGHYICMRWVCRKHLDRAKVYDTKVLIGVSACFVISGLLLTTTYEVPILRYSFVGIILILLIVFHKKVINYVKKLISMRKAED